LGDRRAAVSPAALCLPGRQRAAVSGPVALCLPGRQESGGFRRRCAYRGTGAGGFRWRCAYRGERRAAVSPAALCLPGRQRVRFPVALRFGATGERRFAPAALCDRGRERRFPARCACRGDRRAAVSPAASLTGRQSGGFWQPNKTSAANRKRHQNKVSSSSSTVLVIHQQQGFPLIKVRHG
jgi:hypothetical protein